MTARSRLKKHRAFFFAALAITAAAVLRQIGFRVSGGLELCCVILRPSIYFGLFLTWGISARNRIIQPQVRRYLTYISALMAFWVAVRGIKYSLEECIWLMRHLWYLYYLPMLFIPLLAVFVAMSLGKPENYRLPKWTALIYIPTAALFLLVLTNDLHQLVFVFPEDAVVWMDDYRYGIGYVLTVGWMILCTMTALVTMLIKCRIPYSRKVLFLPCVPVILAVIYGLLYIFRLPWLRLIAGDMTVVFCLLIAAALESCIQCGLIQSNTHYSELFGCSTLRAQITDPEYRLILTSDAARDVPEDIMRQTEQERVLLSGGLRLSGAAIRGGHVLWMEDVSELLEVLDELRDAREGLEDEAQLLQEEYRLRAWEAHIAEQDRLYTIIQRDTARQIAILSELTSDFEREADEDARKRLLGKMIVIGAYLKRRNNLIFIADKTPLLPEKELALTFGESLDNLSLYGVECGFSIEIIKPVPTASVMRMYDFLEEVVERSLDDISAITVRISQVGGALSLTINTDSAVDFSDMVSDRVTAERDIDGEWQLSLRPEAGGEAG